MMTASICPFCEGMKTVRKWVYDRHDDPDAFDSWHMSENDKDEPSMDPVPCRVCNGTGVVWPPGAPVETPTKLPPPYMDINEFCDEGYLQEVNRKYLHPLGLALTVQVDDDGTAKIIGVLDYRDDPEGVTFGDDVLSVEKARHISDIFDDRVEARLLALGYVIQPLHKST
jgi:hypothetical protein